MKKIIHVLTTLAFTTLSVSVFAETENWEGVYTSLTLGNAKAKEQFNENTSDAISADGLTGGLRVGYNGATSDPRVIWGVELATEVNHVSGGYCVRCEKSSYADYGADFGPSLDLRGRVGMTFLSDSDLLIYTFAGVSVMDIERSYENESYQESEGRYAFGPVVGGGVSYKLLRRYRVGLEYAHRFLGVMERSSRFESDSYSFEYDISSSAYVLRIDIML